ncbi:tRNA (N6-threonylcarbamoyladenosine(37)-N6)-methyltransferase TrmO [Candidatus Sumerlaeota bacterium]|nr:tRNA (N6-threonylcarbamoyladenosine(37)-N6)-methyltransferase TrmO [Candidatus Sumerlaeota bacterium]
MAEVSGEGETGPWLIRPIGTIHTPFTQQVGAPIQGGLDGGHRGTVEVFEEFAEGLSDIEGFSHLTLLYLFHRSEGWQPKVRPFLDDAERGVFSTRSPRRPNAIGLTVVRLIERRGSTLEVEDVDMIDGTPLVDIKPHVPDFDCRPQAAIGWLTGRVRDSRRWRADGRFTEPQG